MFFVQARSGRLGMFFKHHGKSGAKLAPRSQKLVTKSVRQATVNYSQTVLENICNVQTCMKCWYLLHMEGGKSAKMQDYCLRIVSLRNCCPANLMLKGF